MGPRRTGLVLVYIVLCSAVHIHTRLRLIISISGNNAHRSRSLSIHLNKRIVSLGPKTTVRSAGLHLHLRIDPERRKKEKVD